MRHRLYVCLPAIPTSANAMGGESVVAGFFSLLLVSILTMLAVFPLKALVVAKRPAMVSAARYVALALVCSFGALAMASGEGQLVWVFVLLLYAPVFCVVLFFAWLFAMADGGSVFAEGWRPPVRAASESLPSGIGLCPSCGKEQPLNVHRCSHCAADFGPGAAWKVQRPSSDA